MAKATRENGQDDIDSMFGDEMLDAALDDAISAAVSAGEEALAEVAAANAQRNSEPIAGPLVTSGILDIKMLTESYEAELAANRPPTAREHDESVPMLGMGSPHSLHVLTPTPVGEGRGDRWLYVAFGFGSATILTTAAAVALYFLVLRGGDKADADLVAAGRDTEQTVTAEATPAANAAEATPEAAATPEVEATPEPEATPKTEVTPRSEATTPKAEATPKANATPVSGRDKDKRELAAVPPDQNPTPENPTSAATGGEACDEVACLIDPSTPCCVNAGIGQSGSRPVTPVERAAQLPQRPTRSDVAGAMRMVKGRVQSCADRNGFQGTVRIRFTVSPEGGIETASTQQGPGEFSTCVADVVRAATFPRSQKGITVTYPLLIK